jgi:hypothetical protein
MKITRCPLLDMTGDIAELIADTDLFYQGLPPVAGGTLDQSARFIKAARYIKQKQNEMLNEIQSHG